MIVPIVSARAEEKVPFVNDKRSFHALHRLGRLQRQSRRAFWASAGPEVTTSELAGWCWARHTGLEKRAPSRWERESMIRAPRSIGAVRTRQRHEWLWRLPDAVGRRRIAGSRDLRN